MMHTSENNWHAWTYDNGLEFGRRTSDEKFKTTYSKSTLQPKSFKEELIRTAKSTLDHFPGLRPSVLFSGGMDSEVVLRAYLEIGANPQVYIMRYENDYNLYDVSYAVTICSMLNVDYKVIDFNLKKFYENDAEQVSEVAQIDRPRALPYCKFMELVDGLPIIGDGNLSVYRTDSDYSKLGTWIYRDYEHEIGWTKYLLEKNITGIAEWFKWTPELVLSNMELKWFNNLVSDQYEGKLGVNSTKILGYREVYPDIINRTKKTGFEEIDHLAAEFEEFLSKKYNGLPFRDHSTRTVSEFIKELSNV